MIEIDLRISNQVLDTFIEFSIHLKWSRLIKVCIEKLRWLYIEKTCQKNKNVSLGRCIQNMLGKGELSFQKIYFLLLFQNNIILARPKLLSIRHLRFGLFSSFSPYTHDIILAIRPNFNQHSRFVLRLNMKMSLFNLHNNPIQFIRHFLHLTNINRERDIKFREKKQ